MKILDKSLYDYELHFYTINLLFRNDNSCKYLKKKKLEKQYAMHVYRNS